MYYIFNCYCYIIVLYFIFNKLSIKGDGVFNSDPFGGF